MTASFNGHINIVGVLLEAKADPNINDEVNPTTATVCIIVT